MGAEFLARSAQSFGAEGAFLEKFGVFNKKKEFWSQIEHKNAMKCENIEI